MQSHVQARNLLDARVQLQLSQNVDSCRYVKSSPQYLPASPDEYICPAFFGVNSGKPSNGHHANSVDLTIRTHK